MSQSECRRIAESTIKDGYEILKECDSSRSDEEIVRKISREFYPFGEREMHPYKMWLKCIEELRRRLGISRKPKPTNPNQPDLWGAAREDQQ